MIAFLQMTEKEYWDWALDQLLNTHSVKPAPNTAAQLQAQWLEKLKRGSSEGNL